MSKRRLNVYEIDALYQVTKDEVFTVPGAPLVEWQRFGHWRWRRSAKMSAKSSTAVGAGCSWCGRCSSSSGIV